MFRKFTSILFAGLLILGLNGCDSDDNQGTTRLNVRLTDAPGDYDAVNIEVEDIQVNVNQGEEGFVSLGEMTPVAVNVLDFTAGKDTLIAGGDLPAGNYSQIRLVLGDNNTVVKDGQEYDLKVPSGSTSGLKLNLHQNLNEGVAYTLILDFDAARSVVETGNGKFNLKPVIRATMEAKSGSIRGEVTPVEEGVAYAIQGQDTITSTFPNEEGVFVLSGIEPGSYVVSYDHKNSEFQPFQQEVEVVLGEVAHLAVELQEVVE